MAVYAAVSCRVVKSRGWSALPQYRRLWILGWMIGISAPSMSMKAPLMMDVILIGARSVAP